MKITTRTRKSHYWNEDRFVLGTNYFMVIDGATPLIKTNDFNEANSMTLSVIGAADFKSNFGLTLNIFNNDPNATMGVYFTTAGGMEVNADVVQKTSIIATISLFIANLEVHL